MRPNDNPCRTMVHTWSCCDILEGNIAKNRIGIFLVKLGNSLNNLHIPMIAAKVTHNL